MKEFFRKYLNIISIIATASIGLMLVVISIFMLTDYQDELLERAESIAQAQTIQTRATIQETLNDYVNKASSVATQAATYTNLEQFNEYLDSIRYDVTSGLDTKHSGEMYQVVEVRYYLGKQMYDSTGAPYTGEDVAQEVREGDNKASYLGYFYDEDRGMQLIGFYAPITNCEYSDGLVLYYTRKKLETFFEETFTNNQALFTMLCSQKGIIIVGDNNTSNLITDTEWDVGNIKNILQDKIAETKEQDLFAAKLTYGKDTTLTVTIGLNEYVLSIGSDPETLKDLVIVEMYDVNTLCEDAYNQVSACIIIIILFTVSAVGIIIFLIIHNYHIRKRIEDANSINQKLNCFNQVGFEDKSSKLLERNLTANYAVILFHIRHFGYLKEKSSESEINSLLHYIKGVVEKSLMEEETYGYIDNGEFLLLLHYQDREALIDRLKILTFLVGKYRGASKLDILIRYGIYEVEIDEKLTVDDMVGYALEASKTQNGDNLSNAAFIYYFYDSELRKIRKMNDDMELRMESALKNGEFQVFFQPKYNLVRNMQDGAEALVRWYDVKKEIYNSPGLFMPLFESNGFVVKLDKYVFERVCEYINYSTVQGRRVYPISVNVSRVTAIQTNFVEFYTKVKNRYGVKEGQIMIEFTESFAYENYDLLCKIVDQLHENGFKCSVDDFGCGYSSFLTLKKLQMDEIKLDKIFLDKGITKVRDDAIYKSVVELGKKLHMKVTQEGVETDADLEYIKNNGCDVVQGYIYSRPIAVSDYIKFVQTTKEHDLFKDGDIKNKELINQLESNYVDNNTDNNTESNTDSNVDTNAQDSTEENINNNIDNNSSENNTNNDITTEETSSSNETLEEEKNNESDDSNN